jgi:hypothetical protein
MKKVLLHLAAVLSLIALGFTFLEYNVTVRHPYWSGFSSNWAASAAVSGIYLGLLLAYFLAIRGLKKRESKGLWVYSLLVSLFYGLYLYAYYTGVIRIDDILRVPYAFFFSAPPMLIPLMPLGQKGRWALPAALFGLLVLSFGVMTWGWSQIFNWDRKASLLFDPTYWTNRAFVSDVYGDYSAGLLLTVDEEGKMYAYVSKSSATAGSRGEGRRPTEVFSVRREGNKFVFTKDFYADQTQAEPVLSIPCMRGHIWNEVGYRYRVEMDYEENPLLTEDELGYLRCDLEFTDRTDVGAEDPLSGRRPEDWPGVEWDVLDQHFIVGEDHRLTNENGMVLLWTYTDDRFILAERQAGAEGVTFEPWACGRKRPGRAVYDVCDMGAGIPQNALEIFTDYGEGVLWPGEPLDRVKETYLAEGWTEAAVAPEHAASLCLFEKEGRRCLLLCAVEDDANSWADWSDEFDPQELLVTGYARFTSDGALEAWGGLVPVEAEQTDHLLTLLNTRAKIGSFGYVDWQASWPARKRLTTDGRLIQQNETGEWSIIHLDEIMEK